MKRLKFRYFVVVFLMIVSCGGDETETDGGGTFTPVLSNKSGLVKIEFVYKNSIFTTTINGTEIALDRALPYGLSEVSIQAISIPNKATCNVKNGDILKVGENSIVVTAEDGTKSTYNSTLNTLDNNSIVEENGNLQVSGNRIVNKKNEAVSFAGNSFFWSNTGWGASRFYKALTVSWLKLDWQATIVRAAMGVQEDGGYLDNK